MKDLAGKYNEKFSGKPAEEILSFFLSEFKGRVAFSTSLGSEDQVLTDMITAIDRSVKIFTLDTGRHFQETYDILDLTEKKYGISILTFFPEAAAVEQMVREKGINLFYESAENRKLCCHIRKTEPLKRALQGMMVWISGLRSEQSITRKDLSVVEWDASNQLIKVNPLMEWTEKQVWEYIRQKKVPYNVLHDKGYPSIGCQPCTRAILPGEHIRSGRWWWELAEYKECGIHNPLDEEGS